MLDRRSQQQIANAFARSRLDLADARAAHASELSKRVENQITLAGQETRIAEQLVEIALNHHANALAMLPKIEETLRRAGCCCQGVQRR